MPVDSEPGAFTGTERLRQVDTHQSAHNRVWQSLAIRSTNRSNPVTTIEVIDELLVAELGKRKTFGFSNSSCQGIHGIGVKLVLIQLQPQVFEGVRRIVAVTDRF